MLALLAFTLALAAPPDLDGLVALAVERDPEALSLAYEADAALARAAGARRPMDPQFMVGVESLFAPSDSPDPTMGMIGVTQMLRGWGEGAALSDRLELDATRADADRRRLEADLRTRLWKSAARIGALTEEIRLIDAQIEGAQALFDLAFARYGAGSAADSGGMGGMGAAPMGGMPEEMEPGVTPPVVVPGGGGGSGMAGMGGAAGGRPTRGPVTPTLEMGEAGSAPAMQTGGDGSGLAALLRLEAQIARVWAEQMGLEADLAGEVWVLGAFVGDEAASAVADAPSAYFGLAEGEVPERELAAVDVRAAQADVDVARAARRPDVMLSVGERFMPSGMPVGTDLAVGIELPLWGSRGRAIDAARASVAAAEARSLRVGRDLDVAVATASAALVSAQARARALSDIAAPRARSSWESVIALFGAGTVAEDEVVRAWEAWIAIEREALAARRDVQLRAADLARVQGTPP